MSAKNWAGILIILQFLDGLFTYVGVRNLGIEAEGNPLIKLAIASFGPEVALITIKLIAVAIIVALVRLRVYKLKLYLQILSIIYLNVVALWIVAFWINGLFSF